MSAAVEIKKGDGASCTKLKCLVQFRELNGEYCRSISVQSMGIDYNGRKKY